MSATSNFTPQSHARVVYDETFRGKWFMKPFIFSMAQIPNVLGYLDHHSENTDGSFSICMGGGGVGVFVSQV
jgi:hypothetical protein